MSTIARKAGFAVISMAALLSLSLKAAEKAPPASPASEADLIGSESPAGPTGGSSKPMQVDPFSGAVPASVLLRVPVTGIVPGNFAVAPSIRNPLENDPDAAARGMRDFDAFNCSGCHAANGAGGMGPSLSNDSWIYRSTPANIYLTILQGRAKGMPSFGALLPDTVIWELVAYIDSIAEKPSGTFGKTISAQEQLPDVEQVSANRLTTTNPWEHTEKFSNGQNPY